MALPTQRNEQQMVERSSDNAADNALTSRASRGLGGTPASSTSLALRKLLHVEQAVEELSDMFLRVDRVLNELGPVDDTEGANPLLRTWDEYQQNFMRVAAQCRRNLHGAAGIMDVCRETLLVEVEPEYHEDAKAGLKIAEELVRTEAACVWSATKILSRLAQDILKLRNQLEDVPAEPAVGCPQVVSPALQAARYAFGVLPIGFPICAFFRRSMYGIKLVLYMLFGSLWGYKQTASGSTPHVLPEPHANTGGAVPHSSQATVTPLTVAEPEPSYPETMKYDMERTAEEIMRFTATWTEIANEVDRWAAYLARRGEMLALRAHNPGDPDDDEVVCDEDIAGLWDAIMDMRHATLVRMHAQKPDVVLH